MEPLRLFQRQALDALEGESPKNRHVLCVAPTGSGKSRIFEISARKPGRRTILISPLVALSRQHKRGLESLGLPVFLEHFPKDPSQSGVWILSPENIHLDRVVDWRPHTLIVDECHCLWEWGMGFRPDFRRVFELFKSSTIERSLWLTATLSGVARADLEVNLRRCGIETLTMVGGFDLPAKLSVHVTRIEHTTRFEHLVQWTRSHGKGLIFSRTRRGAVDFCIGLTHTSNLKGMVYFYHAGMAKEERVGIERAFARAPSAYLVATSAFGMGMHVPDIESVVFVEPPWSLTELAQGLGRCGRGDFASRAFVWWDRYDLLRLDRNPTLEHSAVARFLTSTHCRRDSLKTYFAASDGGQNCGHCDVCQGLSTGRPQFGDTSGVLKSVTIL